MSHHQTTDRLATLGGRLRSVRLARGLTAETIAKELEVSRPTITTWEADKVEKVSEDKLKAFSRLTNVSFEWLLAGVGAPPDLPLDIPSDKFKGMRTDQIIKTIHHGPDLARDMVAVPDHGSATPDAANAQPQARWMIPRDVLSYAMNCDPTRTIIQRVLAAPPSRDIGFARGDFILIDTSRTKINEPGTYIIIDGDTDLSSWTWALARDQDDGPLSVTIYDHAKPPLVETLNSNRSVSGRLMAVLRSV